MSEYDQGQVKDVAALAKSACELKVIDVKHDGHRAIPMALVPDGFTLSNLQGHIPTHADRIRAATTHNSVTSFCDYVNRYKNANTTVFASVLESPYEFLAVLDYHDPKQADWCTHSARLVLTETDEWKTWMRYNNETMGQAEFALFIEDNLNDILEPDGATMLELALNLNATQDCGFKGKLNLHNGDVGLVVDQKTDAVALGKDGEIAIPKELTLKLSPFRGIEQMNVQARFRYNLRPPRLTLGYQMIRPKSFVDNVVGAAFDRIVNETKLPVYSGSFKNMIHAV